jgi:hypothetical protein
MRAAAIRRRPVARRARPPRRPALVKPATARARSRRPAAVLLALLIAALLWWRLHPAEKPAPTAPPVHAVAAAQVLPPVLHRKPAPPKRASRDLLLAAVRERAASLRSCASRPGAPARLPARLHVARSGAMRSIDFPGAPPSKSVGDCVREATMRWDFSGLELPADLELLVTLSF